RTFFLSLISRSPVSTRFPYTTLFRSDLGVARVPLLEDFPAQDIPGTASYMAPELFSGRAGDEFSDLYALGVTVYRTFTAERIKIDRKSTRLNSSHLVISYAVFRLKKK